MATTSPEASSKRPSCSMAQGMNSSAVMRSGRGRVIGASKIILDIARPARTVPRCELASDPSTWPPYPALLSASISVVRLTPNVRQAAALDMPPSSAARMAVSFSSEMARGRPPRRPRVSAARSPAMTRSRIRARSYCARGAEDCEEKLALRRGGVHVFGERSEGDAALPQLPDDGEEVRQRAPEAVKFPDHQRVARS